MLARWCAVAALQAALCSSLAASPRPLDTSLLFCSPLSASHAPSAFSPPSPFTSLLSRSERWVTSAPGRKGAPAPIARRRDGLRRAGIRLKMSEKQTESEATVTSRSENAAGEDGGKGDMYSFRQDDMQVFLKMASEEEAIGNTTGADAYKNIAEKMQNIMSRSNARLMSSLALEDSAEDVKRWPFMHPGLAAQGKTVWVTSDKASEDLKSARGLNAYGPGQLVQWKLKIAELQGPMSIGLTSVKVDLDSSWREPEHFNQAFYITHNGNLYNGGELVYEGGTTLRAGDDIAVSIDGDGVFFSINGNELPACLKPLTGSVRLSVQMKRSGDGLSLLDELVEESEGLNDRPSAYSSTTLTRSLDDQEEVSLLSIITTDSSELSEEEELVAPQAASKSPWEMVVDEDSKRVYYWNKKTQETTWDRPADFQGVSERAFLDVEKETGKLLKKTEEKNVDFFSDNSDGERDSHTTVQFDEDGYPALDRFVYVDEATCIGCTNCATVARSTFFMEQSYGRARAFRQGGDSEDTIAEAVATCPVDCIWYVSWDDLVALETERKYTVINPAARLVGGNFIEYQTTGGYYSKKDGGESRASIMKSGEMRCNNCPTRGCKKCPLYGVGENPEYIKRKAAREARRSLKTSARIDLNDGDDGSSLSQMIYSDSLTDTSSTEYSN